MLDDSACKKELEAARVFAESLGPEAKESFEKGIAFLRDYRDGTCSCVLMPDRNVPYSFGFKLYGPDASDGTRPLWFTGVLLYYGPGETGVGGPQFSVSLPGATGPTTARWEIHT